MSFASLSNKLQPNQLSAAIKQLQTITPTRVAGAAANTAITVAGIRVGDTIVYAEYVPTTFANPTVLSDLVIQDTHASGTLTFASAVDGNTCTINGVVFTVKDTPTSPTHIKTGGSDTIMANNAVATINAYFQAKDGDNYNTATNNVLIASSTGASGVVTIKALDDGVGNAPVITGSSHVTASGSTTASATLTVTSSIADGDTCIVNGVTFTFRTTPTAGVLTDVQVTAADANASAAALNRAINAYEQASGFDTNPVSASVASAVVTLVPVGPKRGNLITIVGGTHVTASAGTLAGGTASGSVKTATNTSAGTVFLIYFSTH